MQSAAQDAAVTVKIGSYPYMFWRAHDIYHVVQMLDGILDGSFLRSLRRNPPYIHIVPAPFGCQCVFNWSSVRLRGWS